MSVQDLKAAATGQATPAEAKNPFDQLKRQLQQGKAEFLPLFGGSEQNVDRFIRVVLNAVLANPDLLDADRRSLMSACMKAAQDGLQPDGREAVLNIYNTKKKWQDPKTRQWQEEWVKTAQYLPMVGGLVKKLYESGEVTYLDAACVYANDRFTYKRGDEPRLEHEPTLADEPGPIVAAYCVVKLKNGEIKREVMPMREIQQVRGASKSKDSGPWVTWFDQQAIKSVIKRIYKQLPKADAFEKVSDYDNQALGFAATPQNVGDIIARQDQPALGNDPSETLEGTFKFVSGDQPEPVYREEEEKPPQARQQPAATRQPASRSRQAPVQAERKPEPKPEQQAGDAGNADQTVTFAWVADQMVKAKSPAALDVAADFIRDVADEEQRAELNRKYEQRQSELTQS